MHDDVKPENIIWDQRAQRGALVDFGAAHEIETTTFDLSGTPCYVAPEYIKKERSEKYDIWALGVTMAFSFRYLPLPDKEWLLPGVFENQSDYQEMQNWIKYVLNLREEMANTIPLLAAMLHKDPRARMSAAELKSSLQGVVG